jgi:hypothetical protein
MAGPHVFLVIMPIVLAIALTIWLVAVFRSNRHPEPGQGGVSGWLGRRTRLRMPGRQRALPTAAADDAGAEDGAGGPASWAPSQGQQQEPVMRQSRGAQAPRPRRGS